MSKQPLRWFASAAISLLAIGCAEQPVGPDVLTSPEFATHSVPAASAIYFTDGGLRSPFSPSPSTPGRVRRVNLDGSGLVDLVATDPVTPFKAGPHSRPNGIALDPVGGQLFWVDFTSGVFKANLDGSSPQGLITRSAFALYGVDVDETAGKVYFGPAYSGFFYIRRSNLDGTGEQSLTTFACGFPGGIAVDPAGGKMYWTESGCRGILSANLDGTNVQFVRPRFTLPREPRGLALHVAAQQIYFTAASRFGGNGQIWRVNFDGTALTLLVSGLNFPWGIGLDLGAGKMYWADSNNRKIQSANLDGSNVQDVITGLDSPIGIALEPNQPPDCSAAGPSVDTLWPPNHKFVPIDIVGVTDPEGDPFTINIDAIWQDEPTDTYGDGKFTPDGMGVGTATAQVRAERSGTKEVPGNGRVYHISFTATDSFGGSCSGTVFVGVPHDQRGDPAVDDSPPLYDSTM